MTFMWQQKDSWRIPTNVTTSYICQCHWAEKKLIQKNVNIASLVWRCLLQIGSILPTLQTSMLQTQCKTRQCTQAEMSNENVVFLRLFVRSALCHHTRRCNYMINGYKSTKNKQKTMQSSNNNFARSFSPRDQIFRATKVTHIVAIVSNMSRPQQISEICSV